MFQPVHGPTLYTVGRRSAMADEDTSDAPTQMYERSNWLSPVETKADLPAGAGEGMLCFVRAENEVYEVIGGKWRVSPEEDDETAERRR
jgi:hypothetical protein